MKERAISDCNLRSSASIRLMLSEALIVRQGITLPGIDVFIGVLGALAADLRRKAFANITSRITVTTATDGNHGRAVAWGAQTFGCRCVIYVPSSCSPGREAAIAGYGATVIRTACNYDDTVRLCAQHAASEGYILVSDTSWPGYLEVPREVMAGYTVLAEEVLHQLASAPAITHVFVQAGVGGLAAAICAHFLNRLGHRAPIFIVVEPENAACLFASAQAGTAVTTPTLGPTIMSGLDCGEPSVLAWDVLSANALAFITVTDDVVPGCMQLLGKHQEAPIVAGDSAVAGLAALLIAANNIMHCKLLMLTTDSHVLIIGTEGATDPVVYRALMSEGKLNR